MKKSIKIFVSALLLASMSLTAVPAAFPAAETASAASTESGSLGSGFKWKWEADSGTLTLTGRGEIPENLSRLPEIPEGGVKTLVIGKNVTDASVLTSVFQEIKPTEAFIVQEGNQYLSASGGGLYSADGKTLISYATGVPDIVIPDGVEAVGPYAFLDCLPDSIILPESVTTLDPDTFSAMGECGPVGIVIPESVESIGYRASKADVYMFQPFFFYMREGEMRCTWSSAGDHVPMLIEAWEHLGFRTPEEIYAGLSEPASYGLRTFYAEGTDHTPYTFFITKEGIYDQIGWVYDGEKVYGTYIEHGAYLAKVDGMERYPSSDSGYREAWFAFNADYSLRNPPLDLMVVTTESLTPISLSEATGGKGVCTGPDTGFRGLVYRGEKAYIYDDNGQMQKSGWYEADGDWYYLNDYGAGAVSCWRDGTDGKPRYLKSDGKMARNEWIEDYGNWYYLGLDGTPFTGARTLNGKTYRFDENGVLLSGEPG